MLSMYFAELGSTGACEMSWLSGLLAGKIGQEPSCGVPGGACARAGALTATTMPAMASDQAPAAHEHRPRCYSSLSAPDQARRRMRAGVLLRRTDGRASCSSPAPQCQQ